jgi:NitT/TauT family transport system permease protein
MLWFGIGDAPAIFTIGIAGFFSILLATVGAVRNVNSSYMYVARNFGLSRFQTLRKIILPASFPYIAQGLHSALTASWIFLVAGEILGVTTGLGFLINDARHALQMDIIMAGIVIIGVIGFCLNKLLSYLERLAAKKWGINTNS